MSSVGNRYRSWWRRGAVIAAFVALATVGYVSVRLAQQQFGIDTLPDLLGNASHPMSKNGLHVEDIAADAKGYQGEILVRGVVAGVANGDPQLIALIDSREARTCQDLKCAKFYLPVRVPGDTPKEWEEIDAMGSIVFGTFKTDPQRPLLQAVSLKNFGPIR
ncbi:MAG: hypothetical protein HYX62_09250 [Gammaproteobacteria bacterium]|jgi:hypothetical protein|nr:hypothetical protein [Gammaproteobacteria bacterium]